MQLAELDNNIIKDLQAVGILPHQFLRHCEHITREILKAFVLRRASGQSKKAIIDDVESWIVNSIAAHSAEATEPLQ
jgi:3-methyladenine DNA glycosylase Mpg